MDFDNVNFNEAALTRVGPQDLLFLGGDLSYAGIGKTNFGTQTTWDRFFWQGESIMTKLPTSVCAGNHDGYSEPVFRGFDLRFSQGPHERKEFKGSPVGYPNYYAYSMGPVRFVVISTEHCGSVKCIMRDEDMGNEQMMWLEQELMMANQNRSPELAAPRTMNHSVASQWRLYGGSVAA